MSHTSTLLNHDSIINFLQSCRLPQYFSKPAFQHIKEFVMASTAKGYRGKIIDLAEWSSCDRTSICHFLPKGVWNESYLKTMVKRESLQFVVKHSKEIKNPIS